MMFFLLTLISGNIWISALGGLFFLYRFNFFVLLPAVYIEVYSFSTIYHDVLLFKLFSNVLW